MNKPNDPNKWHKNGKRIDIEKALKFPVSTNTVLVKNYRHSDPYYVEGQAPKKRTKKNKKQQVHNYRNVHLYETIAPTALRNNNNNSTPF